MRTPTGDYRIDYFNKYGERIPGISIIESSLTAAMETAVDPWPLLVHEAASFTIMRCVFNSLDGDERWLPKQAECLLVDTKKEEN